MIPPDKGAANAMPHNVMEPDSYSPINGTGQPLNAMGYPNQVNPPGGGPQRCRYIHRPTVDGST